MATSNNPTFELEFLDDFEDAENVSKMVAETLEGSKDQQSESDTSENKRFAADLSKRDFEKNTSLKVNNRTRPRKPRTGVFLRSRASFKLNNYYFFLTRLKINR